MSTRSLLIAAAALTLAACFQSSVTTSSGAGVSTSSRTNTGLAFALLGRDPSVRDVAPPQVPSLDAIRAEDLKRDIFFLAGDYMRGREAGTLDELRASSWLAQQLQQIGVEPAGEDGTYYQWWPMRRIRLSEASSIAIDGSPIPLWKDVVVTQATDGSLDAPVVWVGSGSDAELRDVDVKGKVVAAQIVVPPNPPAANVSFRAWRYTYTALAIQTRRLQGRGAVAIVMVGDSTVDSAMELFASWTERGSYGLDSAGATTRPKGAPPVLVVRSSYAPRLSRSGARLTATLATESFTYPSVNIVGKITGSDPKRRDEYVLFSSHQDHDGVRYPMDGDSIRNGADDNASVVVASLAIARAWKKQPNPRTALFVIQGAEERGLLGSNWYSRHPTVPRDRIVAVLNADMIGRNNPDSAALLGVQPPHRNSADLVSIALRANELTGKFKLDSLWDRPTHPEGWYFRSDHLPYARLGIPSIMYSTNLHPDYHTSRDEPQRIDIAKMRRMTQWMYATGWLVGLAPERPKVDAGFKLER